MSATLRTLLQYRHVTKILSYWRRDCRTMVDWFKINRMAENPQRIQVIFLSWKQDEEFILEIGNIIVKVTKSVKLLGITVDNELKFEKHVKTLCKKVCKKVTAFSRVAPHIDQKKRKILYHTFTMLNFNYCPLIWIFWGKTQNKEIEIVHKRALRILLMTTHGALKNLCKK